MICYNLCSETAPLGDSVVMSQNGVLEDGELVACDVGIRDACIFWAGQEFLRMSVLNYVLPVYL